MKLDWQHVVVIVVGLGCGAACIVLGQGNALVQVLAGLQTAIGAVALVLRSVRGEQVPPASAVFPPEEAPTKKEGP